MATSVDYAALASQLLSKVGGEGNVTSLTHCVTRLRFVLKDATKADRAAIEKLPGVITALEAGGQFQVVIGNNVPAAYAEVLKITRLGAEAAPIEAGRASGANLFNRFVQLISSLFQPILWPLAGIGLLKAVIALFVALGWLATDTTTYTVLSAASDGLFYFLPFFLAVTAARRFGANQFTAMAIAGALVYPAVVALASPADFLGIPLTPMSYTSSVLPIIVAVWVQSWLERGLQRVLPAAIRNFTIPFVTVLVMVPLVLLTIGPVTQVLSQALSGGISYIFTSAPWLAGLILGGLWQVFVIFGLHWTFIPLMLNDISNSGFTLIAGPLIAAVTAQAGAALAVAVRTKNAGLREAAVPAGIAGLAAGVTEPIIYGITLPLKKPFYYALAAGAVGGAIAAQGGSGSISLALPSLIALPSFATIGNFTLQLIGTGVAIVLAFLLTLFLGFTDKEPATVEEAASEAAAAAVPPVPVAADGVVEVAAPVAGTTIALSEVADKVFASGVLGAGLGIVPTSDEVVAPFAGEVATVFPTGHAYGIKSDDGVEVLIHIGIDTVQLNGQHFAAKVAQGSRVEAGQLLGTADIAAIAAAGYDPTTIVVITNTPQFEDVLPAEGHTVAAGDTAIVIKR